jgi:hypothetical protein
MALTSGAAIDIDAVETSEWLDALDAVVVHDGPERARRILTRVVERAQRAGAGPIASLNTPYVNTIPAEREAKLPGDRRSSGSCGRSCAGTRWRWRWGPTTAPRGSEATSRATVAGDAVRGRLQPFLARVERAARGGLGLFPGPLLSR